MQEVYNQCIAVLNQEIELIDRILESQIMVRRAVLERSWTDFEDRIGSLQKTGAEFEELDKERAKYFVQLASETGENADGTDFYALIAKMPDLERKILTGLYRKLKFKTFKIQIENDNFIRYLEEIRVIVSGFLEAAFPDRKGKLYSRNGAPLHADMRSMVLNRQF
jgi:hypothetical protein